MNTLEQTRLRTAKIAAAVFAVLLMVMVVWQFIHQQTPSIQLSQYLEQPQDSAKADVLGLAGSQIVLVEVSDSGRIFWYQSTTEISETTMLIDKALIYQGWQALPTEQQDLQSYHYPATNTEAGGYALVSFTQQQDGCSIVVTLM